jgi:hypothetical protein
MSEYVTHYHTERNHQGKSNVVLSSRHGDARREAGAIPRATGWSFALLPSRGGVNSHAISAERERRGWPQTLGYLLFYDDHRRQTHVRDCCRKPALARSPPRGYVIVSIFWPNGIADPKPTPTKLASSRRSVLVPKSRTVTATPWPPCWVVNDPGKGGAHGGQADAVQERQKRDGAK